MTTILGIKLFERVSTAADFQKILSEYGCFIKTRIGLHSVSDGICAPNGIILIEFIGNEEKLSELKQAQMEAQINYDNALKAQPKVNKAKKVGRNDPCPCGSGKKYKNCCGRNA